MVFVADQNTKKKFLRKWIWRDFVIKSYPYLEYYPLTYTTSRGQHEHNFKLFVEGQDLNNSSNWCSMESGAGFPESVRETVWKLSWSMHPWPAMMQSVIAKTKMVYG